jgi:glycosyltransferase involved in cell wall biosynthesis
MNRQPIKKMHIVIDVRMINMSGIGRYIQVLVPVLIENFSKLTVIGKTAEIEKYSWSNRVEIIELAAPIYSISEQIGIFFKTPSCDIFISPHYNSPIFLPQAKKIAVIIPDTNHLVFKNEFSLAKRIYATFFYKVSVNQDIIFTISEFSKSEIVKFTKCNPDKITVGLLSIDKEEFKLLNERALLNSVNEFSGYQDIKYILYIGNVKPHKNLKRALLAFEIAAEKIPDLRFLIVGKKDNFLTGDPEVFKLVEENPTLKEKVDFTGHVSDFHLAYLYKHAKVFLFPSLYEGFGLPPLEAMIFGCPVIVSKEGSLPEICGEAAYYCNAYDVDDIAASIIKVLSDDTLRQDLITKGLKKVNEYDWSHFTNIVAQGLINL